MNTPNDHTFMICAYQENPYLENCILSILNQKVLGNVKISTSTPNEYIKSLAKKYDLPVVVNMGKGNAVDNFNFAYSQAETKLVTLCHQDDYYCSEYLEKVLLAANRGNDPIIIYTDYFEDRGGKREKSGQVLTMKRVLNFPLRFSFAQGNKWIRRRILSVANPICCPAVTFCKAKVPADPFFDKYKSSLDWDAWIRMSMLDGKFIYCAEKLMVHRIWENSTTSVSIADGIRSKEDYEILCQFWPAPLAKAIFALYRQSQDSNGQGKDV